MRLNNYLKAKKQWRGKKSKKQIPNLQKQNIYILFRKTLKYGFAREFFPYIESQQWHHRLQELWKLSRISSLTVCSEKTKRIYKDIFLN